MRIFPKLFIAISCYFTLAACQDCISGEGKSIDETRTVESFNTINLSSSLDLSLVQATNLTAHKVILHAQENIIPLINCEVKDQELNIDLLGCITNAKGMEASAFFAEIKKINLDGSGDISSANTIYSKKLNIDSEGSGDITFTFEGDMLVVNCQGSGDLHIAGSCKDLFVKSDGSGDLDFNDLVSDRVVVDLNGSGNIQVYAKRKAKLELNGSGNILLKGDPQNLEQKRNGSGEIIRIN